MFIIQECLCDQLYLCLQRLCLDGENPVETIIAERLSHVLSLSVDWMSNTIFWLDAGGSNSSMNIEAARVDGSQRRVIVNSTAGNLEDPRYLLAFPTYG